MGISRVKRKGKSKRLTVKRRDAIEQYFGFRVKKGQVRPVKLSRRKAVCYLIPLSKAKLLIGDVIMLPRPIIYYGFLEEIDEETLGNGETWITFQFDCMSENFVMEHLKDMMSADSPFLSMAGEAQSCVIEFSMRSDQVATWRLVLREKPGGDIQTLQEGSWWRLSQYAFPHQNAIAAVKYAPYPGSNDPTTIASACEEQTTWISDLEIPRLDVLRALVAFSHPGEELQKRYPGR